MENKKTNLKKTELVGKGVMVLLISFLFNTASVLFLIWIIKLLLGAIF